MPMVFTGGNKWLACEKKNADISDMWLFIGLMLVWPWAMVIPMQSEIYHPYQTYWKDKSNSFSRLGVVRFNDIQN